jgi:hypothetical protein
MMMQSIDTLIWTQLPMEALDGIWADTVGRVALRPVTVLLCYVYSFQPPMPDLGSREMAEAIPLVRSQASVSLSPGTPIPES